MKSIIIFVFKMKAIIADTCYSEIITVSYLVVNHNGYSFIIF